MLNTKHKIDSRDKSVTMETCNSSTESTILTTVQLWPQHKLGKLEQVFFLSKKL